MGGDTIQLDPYTPGAIVRALYSLWRYSLKMPNTLLRDSIVSPFCDVILIPAKVSSSITALI